MIVLNMQIRTKTQRWSHKYDSQTTSPSVSAILQLTMRHWHALHYPLEGDYLTHSGQVWGLHLPLKDDEGCHSLVVLGNVLGIITILWGKISENNTFTKYVLSTAA